MISELSGNASTSGSIHARAWAEGYELIDLQLSPLGLRAIETLLTEMEFPKLKAGIRTILY
jgi:hypothetical protein